MNTDKHGRLHLAQPQGGWGVTRVYQAGEGFLHREVLASLVDIIEQ
ncbi:MAG TPA: hypothetical protein PJ988_08215 [Anaerolinea sp.]|nr:hypothetical protein [Anaerolinea sp.]